MEGVILQTYGSGNVPDRDSHWFQELKAASDRGVVIVNCTQCSKGVVKEKYSGSIVSATNQCYSVRGSSGVGVGER